MLSLRGNIALQSLHYDCDYVMSKYVFFFIFLLLLFFFPSILRVECRSFAFFFVPFQSCHSSYCFRPAIRFCLFICCLCCCCCCCLFHTRFGRCNSQTIEAFVYMAMPYSGLFPLTVILFIYIHDVNFIFHLLFHSVCLFQHKIMDVMRCDIISNLLVFD